MRSLLLRAGSAPLFILLVLAACKASTTDPANPDGSSSSGSTSSSSSSGDGSNSSSTSGSGSSSSSGGSTSGNPPVENVDVTEENFEFGGRTRLYFLAKPKDYDANKTYPLVMSFHGNPGQAVGMKDGLPFDAVSGKEAVIVYPQGIDNNWDLYTPTDNNNDMYFIEALVDEVRNNKANIDKGKVFGFGYSGGAFFITQVACRFQGLFKAISVNAGGGPDEAQMGFEQNPQNGCYICPGGPIPTLVTHGQDDGEVEVASGMFTADCFASTNGCNNDRSASTPAPCETYDGCPAELPVKRCIIPGLGHGVWNDAMVQAWAFFKPYL